MDHLYTPWRYAFISAEKTDDTCVLCAKLSLSDRDALIVFRGTHHYICLNLFPYNAGHVMIVPNTHVQSLHQLSPQAAHEMMELAQVTERVLQQTYHPDGINAGINLGKAAGAGIAGHLHMHLLPRWIGDANFMTVVGDTRVLPEELSTTWERLRQGFADTREQPSL